MCRSITSLSRTTHQMWHDQGFMISDSWGAEVGGIGGLNKIWKRGRGQNGGLQKSSVNKALSAFFRILSYLSQLKIIRLLFYISFLSQVLQIFISSWQSYHLVEFIASYDMTTLFSYSVPFVEGIQIYISFLFKEFFCLWKKIILSSILE